MILPDSEILNVSPTLNPPAVVEDPDFISLNLPEFGIFLGSATESNKLSSSVRPSNIGCCASGEI